MSRNRYVKRLVFEDEVLFYARGANLSSSSKPHAWVAGPSGKPEQVCGKYKCIEGPAKPRARYARRRARMCAFCEAAILPAGSSAAGASVPMEVSA